MSQTSYPTFINTGAVGELAFANDMERNVESYSNPTNPLDFGIAVAKVPGFDFQCDLMSPGAKLVGITQRDLQRIEGLYPVKSAVAVVSFGSIWVNPEVDVNADDPVYVRVTAFGPNTRLGAFRNDADGGNAVLVPDARYLISSTSNPANTLKLAVVQIFSPIS